MATHQFNKMIVKMKNLRYPRFLDLFVFTMSLLLLVGCGNEDLDDLELEPAKTKTGLLSGTWNLVSVIQTDEDAVRKGFPSFVLSEDITNAFAYTDLVLTLDNGSFNVDLGNSPDIIGAASGTYNLDAQDFPSEIQFQGGNTIQIATYNGLLEDVLTLKLTRFQKNSQGEITNAFVSYEYKFEKQ